MWEATQQLILFAKKKNFCNRCLWRGKKSSIYKKLDRFALLQQTVLGTTGLSEPKLWARCCVEEEDGEHQALLVRQGGGLVLVDLAVLKLMFL